MRFALSIVVCGLLLSAAASAQQVYRWVDEDGVVHYSDQPPPGETGESAESVDIEVPPGIGNPVRGLAVQPRGTRTGDDDDAAATETVGGYRSASIVEPQAQQVLWNIATRLSVSMTLEPALAGSHRVQWLLDGQPIGEPGTSLSTTLTPVYRGEHTVSATIVDGTGSTIFSTESVTFYVQQASVFRR